MNVLAYQKCALAYRKLSLDVRCEQQGALLCDALDARCALLQTLLRVTLAFRPFQIHALMQIDVGCPLARLQSPSTLIQSAFGIALREALSDQRDELPCVKLELHRDQNNEQSMLA
jgi:hypothetical protein